MGYADELVELYDSHARTLHRYLAAYLPNLKVLDGQADFAGRPGTGFGLVADSTQYELIIDPATGTYLGWKEYLVGDWHGLPAGTVVNTSSLTTKVVGAMGQR